MTATPTPAEAIEIATRIAIGEQLVGMCDALLTTAMATVADKPLNDEGEIADPYWRGYAKAADSIGRGMRAGFAEALDVLTRHQA